MKCKACGRETGTRAAVCNDRCRYLVRNRAKDSESLPERICEWCGENFRRWSNPAKDAGRACSRICGWKLGTIGKFCELPRPKKLQNICVVCQSLFSRRSLCCSTACLRKKNAKISSERYRRENAPYKITGTCSECGEGFTRDSGRGQRREALFCSETCSRRSGKRQARSTRRINVKVATKTNDIPILRFNEIFGNYIHDSLYDC